MADLFYEKRATKFLLRKCFDRLRVGAHAHHKKDMKDEWLSRVCNNSLLRQCFNDLALYTKRRVKAKHAETIVMRRNELRLKNTALEALASKTFEK